MSTVLAFVPRGEHRPAPLPFEEPGRILLFTGVRYERARPAEDDAAAREGATRRARPRKRR